MKRWREQEAKERLAEVLDASTAAEPQLVDRDDGSRSVVLPYMEFCRLKAMEARVAAGETEPSFHEWLFAPKPIFDFELDQSFIDRPLIPPRPLDD